jgi:hypothetical protein
MVADTTPNPSCSHVDSGAEHVPVVEYVMPVIGPGIAVIEPPLVIVALVGMPPVAVIRTVAPPVFPMVIVSLDEHPVVMLAPFGFPVAPVVGAMLDIPDVVEVISSAAVSW